MMVEAVKWVGQTNGFLDIIDQRQLPADYVRLQCRNVEQVYEAIKTLSVRGAPAIGITGAYGLVLGLQHLGAAEPQEGISALRMAGKRLKNSRPTAVNLAWAIDRVIGVAEEFTRKNPDAELADLQKIVLSEADEVYNEDVEMCRQIGLNGQKFIPNGGAVLTHCNAGALATAGVGTALALMFEAKKRDKDFTVYVDETRPLLQGARLTAWELLEGGIDVTVICDNMAGWLMKQGKIDAVITGADRIAANGDAANKIGTYSLSVLAAHHGVKFYIAAPSSTFDVKLPGGDQIPIEQRSEEEVLFCGEQRIAPVGAGAYNPAFDVTPAKNITAIITERGVIQAPDAHKIAAHFKQSD